jgi:hypothetical protein
VPAASVSLFRKPNFFNDVCRSAAAHGFLPAKRRLFLSKISNTDLTIDANRPALAAGLYVVLNGDLSSLITNEGPQETSYKPRPPACGAARDA